MNDKQFLHHFKRKPCFDTGRKLSEEEIVVLAGNFDGHVGSKALRASMEDVDMDFGTLEYFSAGLVRHK